MEQSLVFIKPDAVKKQFVGQIIARFEANGLQIVSLKKMAMTCELADKHYAEHVDKPFYPGLREFVTSGPIVAMVLEGEGAIAKIRTLCGATNPEEADAGTIRADFGGSMTENAVHASDSSESAAREIGIFFKLF